MSQGSNKGIKRGAVVRVTLVGRLVSDPSNPSSDGTLRVMFDPTHQNLARAAKLCIGDRNGTYCSFPADKIDPVPLNHEWQPVAVKDAEHRVIQTIPEENAGSISFGEHEPCPA